MPRLAILVGTRKGLFILKSGRDRRRWSMDGQHFLGQIVNHAVVDPRDGRTVLAAVRAGHLGPTIYRSPDAGATWSPLNRGCAAEFLPDPDAPYGHDPHFLRVHPTVRDVVYQQNHCGIYRLDRAASRWQRLASGLPKAQAWFTVKRQALGADSLDPVGLYFGTTGGEVWASFDEGRMRCGRTSRSSSTACWSARCGPRSRRVTRSWWWRRSREAEFPPSYCASSRDANAPGGVEL